MSQMPRIRLLVTDLDNTLYDWVTYFAASFYRMVEVAAKLLEVERERLLGDLQAVHRAHHNSEQPFGLLETEVVQERLPALSRHERYLRLKPAFDAFEAVRAQTLRVYPGVVTTLRSVGALGCTVVGHTEAAVTVARFRLTYLGLAPYLLGLYAIQDSGLGHPDPQRARPIAPLPLAYPLPYEERKPDPHVLLDICRAQRVDPEECVYVGDSISRDIGMANAAGVHSVWAEYGTRYDREDWERLVRITHWTTADVERANEAARKYEGARPEITLKESMSELLEHFAFEARENDSQPAWPHRAGVAPEPS